MVILNSVTTYYNNLLYCHFLYFTATFPNPSFIIPWCIICYVHILLYISFHYKDINVIIDNILI